MLKKGGITKKRPKPKAQKLIGQCQKAWSGWWFGTWLDYDFPIILRMECHHPNWRTHSIIFQRIPSSNHHLVVDVWLLSAVLLSMYPTGVRMINIQPKIKALIINGQLFPNHDEHINCKGLTNHVSGIPKELACWVSRIFLVGRLPLPFHAELKASYGITLKKVITSDLGRTSLVYMISSGTKFTWDRTIASC